MLRIEGLTKTFGDFTAVRDLSFVVNGGEIIGLLGPNGAGKTTTIRCVTSILQPTRGRVFVNGHDVVAEPEAAKRGPGCVGNAGPLRCADRAGAAALRVAVFRAEDEMGWWPKCV